jgi:hypothetical protein
MKSLMQKMDDEGVFKVVFRNETLHIGDVNGLRMVNFSMSKYLTVKAGMKHKQIDYITHKEH